MNAYVFVLFTHLWSIDGMFHWYVQVYKVISLPSILASLCHLGAYFCKGKLK
jgi:hypothetical protein